ncbi:MAG TPA: response regulator [Thermoanaerobaculia bacterium]|nr:response regulator [Thermoanaerobaculia bacterium]
MNANAHRRVLLADDDPEVRGILNYVLRQQNLAVDLAVDGAEALDLLRDNRYSVVILDLMMPGVDGFGVLDAIYSGEVAEPPVVLVVSGADRATLNRLDASRIHGIVRKPFDPNELAAVVVACVDIRGRNTFETMAMAMISSAPIIAWLKM